MELESYDDYPKSASNNACRALKWVEENGWGSCGEDTGKQRAHQLCNGENISRDTIARMASFKRHQQHKDVPYSEGCGGLMWDSWGGTSGIEWAQRKLDQIKKMERIETFSNYIRRDLRVSIDFDGIITNKNIISILNGLKPLSIKDLFIITNRKDTGMIRLATKLNIPRTHLIRVDSDTEKYNEINNLRIDYHLDNNEEFLGMIGGKGIEIR